MRNDQKAALAEAQKQTLLLMEDIGALANHLREGISSSIPEAISAHANDACFCAESAIEQLCLIVLACEGRLLREKKK